MERENLSSQEPAFDAAPDKDGYVNFGEVSRKLLGKQCQYGSRYVDGAISGYPNLGNSLRFKGNTDDYHNLRIHQDDIPEFINRYEKYQQEKENHEWQR